MNQSHQLNPEKILTEAPAFSTASPKTIAELAATAQVLTLDAGAYLFRVGEPSDAVYLIVTGLLELYLPEDASNNAPFTRLGPGELVGETHIITGGRRTGDVRAVGRVELVRILREAINRIAEKQPAALDGLIDLTRKRLQLLQVRSALRQLCDTSDEQAVNQLTKCAQWLHLPRGEQLVREGDPADCLYIVVSGRLQASVSDSSGDQKVLGQIGIGETVGEMALVADDCRSANVTALRDCHLARFERDSFLEVARQHPVLLINITRGLINRLNSPLRIKRDLGSLRILVIVPASPQVAVQPLTEQLSGEMAKFGSVRLIDHQSANADLGFDTHHMSIDHSHSVLLSAWLAEQEAQYDYILLLADAKPTPWTERCIRQADIVLMIAEAVEGPEPGEVERGLLTNQAGNALAPTALLLIHAHGTVEPGVTANWLSGRGFAAHYHLRRGQNDDISRVARLLTGNAVGVVLGGGGARGAAHIGVLRALRESGVPIDMIGGTSSGAAAAAQYAMGWDDKTILEENIDGFVRDNPFGRLTLPLISMIGRDKMDALTQKMFGMTLIEDLWIDFFCVSCNLSKGEPEVHRQGLLWKAIRATSSLPGIAVPVVQDGELLVDGGVVDNLPGSIMGRFMSGKIIVVDVSPENELSVNIDYADLPGAWRLLWNRLNPFSKKIRFPSIADVLLRTVTVSSLPARAQSLADADLVLRPPIHQYGMMDFASTEEIAAKAYVYTLKRLHEVDLPRIKTEDNAGHAD